MLSPATKRWEDHSTTKRFHFVFYCDCCGRAIPSPEYTFQSGFRPKLIISEGERRARELVWQQDHAAAYERANLDMLSNHIHSCEICRSSVCGDCACVCDELRGGVCCSKCLAEQGYHGIKPWEGE